MHPILGYLKSNSFDSFSSLAEYELIKRPGFFVVQTPGEIPQLYYGDGTTTYLMTGGTGSLSEWIIFEL